MKILLVSCMFLCSCTTDLNTCYINNRGVPGVLE